MVISFTPIYQLMPTPSFWTSEQGPGIALLTHTPLHHQPSLSSLHGHYALIHRKRIWPVSLSTTLPPTVQLDGLDITDAQFPAKEWLPANVMLDTWDAFSQVPETLIGNYDIINIRYIALVLRENNFPTLLRNLVSLLSK